MLKRFIIFGLIFLATGFAGGGRLMGQEQHKPEKPLRDTLDGAIDLSYYLYNLHGFLPIIMPITEPAVGYGAVGAAVFFIPKKEKKTHEFRMPDIVAAGGGYTENKTWLTGAGYFGFWNKDRVRYRGVVGYADVNLKYYGRGGGFLDQNPAKFNIRVFAFVQQAIFRLGESRFMLGGNYVYAKTEVRAFEDSKLPFIDPKEFEMTNSMLSLIGEYENFDNIFSPEKGLRANITYTQNMELIGADRDYGRLTAFAHYYLPVFPKRWISGFRFEGQMATGNPPFFAYPFLILRGVPAMRYQGQYTALVETEQLYMFSRRWGVVGFAGYGQTFSENMDGNQAWNAGGGFRYLLARMFGLKMGVDVAFGPEDWAVYIVFGTAWIK
jgi:hypothetical protein